MLRSRMVRHLPFGKVRILSEAVARGQAGGAVNPDIDSGLIVFSIIGLVMTHMATARFGSEVFARKAPSREIMGRHIAGLLLRGMRPAFSARRGKQADKK
jgi:hypothetical protein